jgi:iron complex transport system ATP-binding protein
VREEGAGLPTRRETYSVLRLDNVSMRYSPGQRDPMALERVSMEVRPGELTALLGPNGSGKSTLLRLAAGLLPPSEGRVWVFGRDLRAMDRRELARGVAFLVQNESVALGYRVRDVVSMGRAPHQNAWMQERTEDRRVVAEALLQCDLDALAERRVDELSVGEQRRVALARALAQEPRLLLLDEPSAFLDVRHRLALHELLARIVARGSIACVVAMHELEAAAQLATGVVLLRGGRVVAAGRPDEVMTSGRLREVFDVEVEVVEYGPARRKVFLVGPQTAEKTPLEGAIEKETSSR